MWLYYIFGFVVIYLFIQISFVFWQLIAASNMHTLKAQQNKLLGTGKTFEEIHKTESYTISHTVMDGIERITCTPKQLLHETPILMAHGMVHGVGKYGKNFSPNGAGKVSPTACQGMPNLLFNVRYGYAPMIIILPSSAMKLIAFHANPS